MGLIAADVHRPAAYEQLSQLGENLNVPVYGEKDSKDAPELVKKGMEELAEREILIIDTAGRLHTSRNLMSELEKMYRLSQKNFSSFNINSLITLDASLGQNSLIQAKDFASKVQLDGAILTKMDGTAKGGIIFPLYSESNIAVKFLCLESSSLLVNLS